MSDKKLRMIESFHTEAHVTAEVFFGKLGSPGIIVIQADTDEGPADITLTPREAFDLMLWLQCALSIQPGEELALQTRLATDRNRVIGEMGQEIERLKAERPIDSEAK